MWELIVSFPDHCLSFYLLNHSGEFKIWKTDSTLKYLEKYAYI